MNPGISFEKSGGQEYVTVEGAITDTHTHPRLFDARLPGKSEIPNGKAGIKIYSETALLNGVGRALHMPNESLRIWNPEMPDKTELIPFPITTEERLYAAIAVSTQNSLMHCGMIFGVDRDIIGLGESDAKPSFTTENIEKAFASRYVRDYTASLKIFGDPSTGGYNIPLEYVIPVSEVWHKHNPDKPVDLHVEDGHVGEILSEWPQRLPVNVRHVSSRQELEAVIIAIENGLDVQCEATPHHLFLTDQTREALHAIGCVKPSLKSDVDRKFLWENLDYIHWFGSDCAPHRRIDKVGPDGKDLDNPAFGIANHDVFIPLFIQAIQDGLLTEQQLHDRIVINPAKRFNLPYVESTARFDLVTRTPEDAIRRTPYGCSPFANTPEDVRLAGRLSFLKIAGRIVIGNSRLQQAALPRYDNIIKF